MKNFFRGIMNFFEKSGGVILAFLATLAIGILLIRIIYAITKKTLKKSKLAVSVVGFILVTVKFVLWVVLLFILAAIAKIPTTPLITGLGAVGLALSLAVKDSLTNLANGLVLMGTKPFKEGDFVDIDGFSGDVVAIKMMNTELLTPDNKKILVPNGKVTNSTIVNYTALPTRRVQWEALVPYETDTVILRKILLEIMASEQKIQKTPPPTVLLSEQTRSGLLFYARAWVNSADFWDVFWQINETIATSLAAANIPIAHTAIDLTLPHINS